MPRRELVIRLSEQAQTLNRGAFIEQQSAMTEVYKTTQRRIWQIFGLSLATSLGIALLATLHAGRLEDQLRRQRAKDVQSTRDLQALSAKLLTAQEEERRSIARELHDEVGQALTAIKVELAVAQRAMGGSASGALDDVRSIADGVLHTVRDLSHLLHPSLLDDLGLASATEWYLKGFGRRHDVRVDLLHDRMDDRLAHSTETAAFRIIQEALTNVAKHAKATSCRVYLQRLTNTILITIEDDGIGFDPDDTPSASGPRGLGLVGIRERVAQLHGTVRVESASGKGTRITVELPGEHRTGTETENSTVDDAHQDMALSRDHETIDG
jgi:signal transduction histidine kinase